MFIMLDGIDGSGKSTVIETWKKYLSGDGKEIFDLKDYWQKNHRYPEYSRLNSYNFVFSCEPTYAPMGLVIRNELIKSGLRYPPLSVAEAYALDRLILYTKIIIPALRDGKSIIQDRGISTSLCYQPLMTRTLTTKKVSRLVGNELALKYRPNYLVLLDIDPAIALKRLSERSEKQDNAIFEKLTFQKKIARVFASKTYQKIFTQRGTRIHYLPAGKKIGIMKQKATNLLHKILDANNNMRHSS